MFMSICFPPILYHAARLVEDAPGQIQRAGKRHHHRGILNFYPNETIIEKLFPATDAIAQGAEALRRRKSAAFLSFSFQLLAFAVSAFRLDQIVQDHQKP
jgi:hypothetical protein